MSTYPSDYAATDPLRSLYFPKISVAAENKSSFYSQLVANLYTKDLSYDEPFTGQVFFEEDLTALGVTGYDPDLVISNCSSIKTTEDGAFDYVISNNKVYLLSINVVPSYDASTVIYEDTFEHENGEIEQGWSLKIPDTIENLPVVSLGTGFFNQHISSYFGNNPSGSFDIEKDVSRCINIHLPSQLEIIGPECFVHFSRASSYTGELPGIKLPDTLRSIYAGTYSSYTTFIRCDDRFFTEDSLPLPDLEKIDPQVATNIASYFSMTSPLTYLPTKSNPRAYYINAQESDTTDLIIPEGCKGILALPYNVTSLTIPESVTAVCSFASKSNLTTLKFANNRTSITKFPVQFLYNCSALTSLDLPEGITEISKEFAENCSKLPAINIPEGVTRLGNSCFRGCKITNITLPSTLTYISDYSFYEPSGTAAKTIRIKATTPPTIQHNDGIANNKSTGVAKIIVPKGCLDKYKKASNWSTWASKMEESTEW
jgi:hypothetical protein